MGHYDDQIEEDYARQRSLHIAKEKANREKYKLRVAFALAAVKKGMMEIGNSRQIIHDQFEILELLLTKELSDDQDNSY
jgi:hypothetical protein